MADLSVSIDLEEEEFYQTYRPLRTEHGDLRLYSPHDPAHREAIDTALAERRLWTMHHGDYNTIYFWSGAHFVNRLDYVICEVPFEEGADIITFDADHEISWECEWCGREHEDITRERYDELCDGRSCSEGCAGDPDYEEEA